MAEVQGLFVQQTTALRGFVLALVADWGLVEEVVQETLRLAKARAAEFHREKNFRVWLWNVAQTPVVEILANKTALNEQFAPEVIEALIADPAAASWPGEDQAREVAGCVAAAGAPTREAVEWRYLHGKTLAAVAAQMTVTLETVQALLVEARRAVRAMLAQGVSSATPAAGAAGRSARERTRLQDLAQRHCDQVLVVEERFELEQMLLASAAARVEFWAVARSHAVLRQWGETERGRRETARAIGAGAAGTDNAATAPPLSEATPLPSAGPEPAQLAHWWQRWPVAVAVVAVIGLVVVFFNRVPRDSGPKRDALPEVAVLSRAVDAVWAESGAKRQHGEVLEPGWLRLNSGAVLVVFASGGRAVLEGPGELQLMSDHEAFLLTGKLRLRLLGGPQFVLSGPDFRVVGQQTEFACFVPPVGAAEVHVLAGGLELQYGTTRRLYENEAVRLEGQQPRRITANREAFLDEETLARREVDHAPDRFVAWRQSRARWVDHPAAVVYLDCERTSNERGLVNRASHAPVGSDAAVVGCEMVEGRWPGKSAVEFKRGGDRLRLTVSGAFMSVSLLAWVRVAKLEEPARSLLMTESVRPGEVHWYVGGDGSLGLAVRGRGRDDAEAGDWQSFNSPPGGLTDALGKWTLLATVFDAPHGAVTHYVNGLAVGSGRLTVSVPLRLDNFEIGNWPGGAAGVARNFRGRLDELEIFGGALSADEVQAFFEAGRPEKNGGSQATK